MEYKITEWNGKKDMELEIKGRWIEKMDLPLEEELELNLKHQL